MPVPYTTEDDYFKAFLLRRINGVGIMWNRPSDVWRDLKKDAREKAFRTLLDEGKIIEISLENRKSPFYIASDNLSILQSACACECRDKSIRILAPLDNMLWDRKLAAELFGFEYKWEVYTPVSQREYGYYVLPVFFDAEFIGRIEMETDKKNKSLIIKNLWMENGLSSANYRNEIINGIERFTKYNRCTNYIINFTL